MPIKPIKKTILYVLGLGRSGTTLVDIVLGNGDDVFSCGELNRYPLRQGVRRNTPADSDRGTFWDNVRRDLGARDPRFVSFDRLMKLHRRYEYHLGHLRDRAIGARDTLDLKEYYAFLNALYDVLFNLTAHSILVDSSKYSGRAWHLARALPPDTYNIAYVYVRRDPVAVVRSFRKKGIEQDPQHWLIANLLYFVVNRLCMSTCDVLERKFPVARITYEEFLGNPESCLSSLQHILGVDLSAVVSRIRRSEPLIVGNLFDGNRIRNEEKITLRPPADPGAITILDRFTRMLNGRTYYGAASHAQPVAE